MNVEKSQIDGTVFVFQPIKFAMVFSDAVVSVSVMREVRVVHIAALRKVPILVVQVDKRTWPESIVIHDKEVDENSSSLLDHTDLKVGIAE